MHIKKSNCTAQADLGFSGVYHLWVEGQRTMTNAYQTMKGRQRIANLTPKCLKTCHHHHHHHHQNIIKTHPQLGYVKSKFKIRSSLFTFV